MDFSWTPEQRELRDAVRRFARGELCDDLAARAREHAFARDLWSRCAEFGIQGMPFPLEYGGGGLDILTTVIVMETLGSTCPDGGLLFGINAQMWSVQMPIDRLGTEEQRRRWLPRLCGGEWIGAHGMSEPDSAWASQSRRWG